MLFSLIFQLQLLKDSLRKQIKFHIIQRKAAVQPAGSIDEPTHRCVCVSHCCRCAAVCPWRWSLTGRCSRRTSGRSVSRSNEDDTYWSERTGTPPSWAQIRTTDRRTGGQTDYQEDILTGDVKDTCPEETSCWRRSGWRRASRTSAWTPADTHKHTFPSHTLSVSDLLIADWFWGSPPPWRCPPASCGSTRCNTNSFHCGQICTSYEPSSATQPITNQLRHPPMITQWLGVCRIKDELLHNIKSVNITFCPVGILFTAKF